MGVVAVTASGNKGRIRRLAEISYLPDGLLNPEEVQEISDVGKTVHWRHYTEHMEKDFPLLSSLPGFESNVFGERLKCILVYSH